MKLLGIDNVFLQVKNLDHANQFYQMLGFVPKINIPQIPAILFSVGTEEPGIILCQTMHPSPSKLWIEVIDAHEIENACKKINIVGRLFEHGVGFTFEIIDEDNNIIGFADYTKKPELARKLTQ